MSVIKLEAILDEIAIQLIQSNTVNQDYVRQNQKTIKNGIFTVGRANADRLILFEKDIQDTRVKHLFLTNKGKKVFEEIFLTQKKRIYNALLNSSSEQVINFENVLKKIINE